MIIDQNPFRYVSINYNLEQSWSYTRLLSVSHGSVFVPSRSRPRLLGVDSSTTTHPKHLDHIPRPHNASMIFRSEFIVTEKPSHTTERDNRHISRIIGNCWNLRTKRTCGISKLSPRSFSTCEDIRTIKFTPAPRANKPRKRNVKRAGEG